MVLRNSGPGVAHAVVIADDDKQFLASVSVISPGGAAAISRRLGADGFYVYAQDGLHRWWLTRAVYDGLAWSDGSAFTNRYLGRIGAWRIPWNVRRRLERDAESSGDVWRSFGSPFGKRWWTSRIEALWTSLRIGFPRWLETLPERSRVRRFGARRMAVAAVPGTEQERLLWPVDVTGLANCWKGPRSLCQITCERDDTSGDLFCEVDVSFPMDPNLPVRGLLRISSAACVKLPQGRTERIREVRRRFDAYICRLRPTKPFVFSLHTVGPFLIDRL